jgi:hypothetical protein
MTKAPRLQLALLALLTWCTASLSAQQLTFTQDLAFQTITPTPARAGSYLLYPYGAAHFAARARDLVTPCDYAVYDSLGNPSGLHFVFHPSLSQAIGEQFVSDAAGNVYIGGSYADTTLPLGLERIVVAKYLANGNPDLSWGQAGIWYGDTTSFGGVQAVPALAVLASGAVMLIDEPIIPGSNGPYYQLRRLTPAGQLDATFGIQGSTLLNPDNRPANAFYIAADGSTYACANVGSPIHSYTARWLPDGSLDTTFRISGSMFGIYNILGDGRIISNGRRPNGSYGLRRHHANGTADSSYVAPVLPQFEAHSPLPGGGHIFYSEQYNGTPFPLAVDFTAILPDGDADPRYMPAGLPMLFQIPPSFWPAPGCHPSAYPSFGSIFALGPRRILIADYLLAQVIIGGSHHDYEYFVCPRIVALVTDLQTVELAAPGIAGTLVVFPNPIRDHASLRIPTRAKAAHIQLYDLAGKALALPPAEVSAIEGGLQYDFQGLDRLAAGLYLLRVEAGGQHFAAKLRKD